MLAFFIKCKFSCNALHRKKKANAYIGWLQIRHNRSSSLSENSLSKNASESLLIYSLTINKNWTETKVKGLNDTKLTRSRELNKS